MELCILLTPPNFSPSRCWRVGVLGVVAKVFAELTDLALDIRQAIAVQIDCGFRYQEKKCRYIQERRKETKYPRRQPRNPFEKISSLLSIKYFSWSGILWLWINNDEFLASCWNENSRNSTTSTSRWELDRRQIFCSFLSLLHSLVFLCQISSISSVNFFAKILPTRLLSVICMNSSIILYQSDSTCELACEAW